MNIIKLSFQFLTILVILTITTHSFASTNTNILELEGYENTYRGGKLSSLFDQAKLAFTREQWDALVGEPITISLKKLSTRKVQDVSAQFYKEKFLEQFINDDMDFEGSSIEISFPYKFRHPDPQHPDFQKEKYIVLKKINYMFATEIDTLHQNIVMRYYDGIQGNLELKYLQGKEKKINIPHFLTDEVLQDISDLLLVNSLRARLNSLKNSVDDVRQFVHEKLYEDCNYYKVISGEEGETSLREISFENSLELQDKLKLTRTKNDDKLWLTTVLTEKFRNGHSAHLMLKTPFEIVESHEIMNERIGDLDEGKESYRYLELSSLDNQTVDLNYVNNQPFLRERGIDLPFPTVVKLVLGINSKDKWNEYLTTSPIKYREKYPEGTLRNQVNACNYITLMGDALRQNSMIRTVEVYTDSLTPSLYNTFLDWSGPNRSREIFISPLNNNESFELLDSKGNKLPSTLYRISRFYSMTDTYCILFMPKYCSRRININSLFSNSSVFLDNDLKKSEKIHEILQGLENYKDSTISKNLGKIYSFIAKHCFENKKAIKKNELGSIYRMYNEWIGVTKASAISQLTLDDYYPSPLKILPSSILIENEYLLQAIFFEKLGSNKSLQGNTNVLKEYSNHKLSIKFNLSISDIFIRKSGMMLIQEIFNIFNIFPNTKTDCFGGNYNNSISNFYSWPIILKYLEKAQEKIETSMNQSLNELTL